MSEEVAIIGAGPIGLELAIALKRAQVEYIHFESGSVGETIAKYPPRTGLYSGLEGLAIAQIPILSNNRNSTREEYLTYLRQLNAQFRLAVRTHERVVSLSRRGGGFELGSVTRDGKVHKCLARTVVLATGSLSIPRRLNIPGEDLPHVSHHLGESEKYSKGTIIIVGGRNSALEAVLRCYEQGASVILSYRRTSLCPVRSKSRLVRQVNDLICAGRIRACFNTVSRAITPTHILLESKSGEQFNVAADGILLMTGYLPDVSLFQLAGVRLDSQTRAPFFRSETMETNVEGLYVAGTITAGIQEDVRVFIETCHAHIERIMPAILNRLTSPGASL
jgi:thioredoxin reductase (NADPH)